MSVTEVPHRIQGEARGADFIGQEEPPDGPADLRADLVDAELRRLQNRGGVIQKHCDAMEKLQRAGLPLGQTLAFSDIFDRNSQTVLGQRKTIDPEDSFGNAGVLILKLTKSFRLAGQRDFPVALRCRRIKKVWERFRERLTYCESDRSAEFTLGCLIGPD